MTEDTKITFGKQFFTKNTGSVYEFYLSGEIEDASGTIYKHDFSIVFGLN